MKPPLPKSLKTLPNAPTTPLTIPSPEHKTMITQTYKPPPHSTTTPPLHRQNPTQHKAKLSACQSTHLQTLPNNHRFDHLQTHQPPSQLSNTTVSTSAHHYYSRTPNLVR
ncbi:hypothetical protein M758_5G132600 [Ceratodon purpureus]|nr:hypothetical protein M758_5G132600 [Ceratodon purpureus]